MSSRYQIAAPHFKEWADSLIFTLNDLTHVRTEEILFIEDSETETKSENKKYMDMKRIPEFVEDFLGQHFGGVPRKAFAVIIYRLNINALDTEALLFHLAEQLMKIPAEGKGLIKPDVNTFDTLARIGGHNWKDRIQEKLPHLLKELPPGYAPPPRQVTLDELGQKREEKQQPAMVDIIPGSEAQVAAAAD